MMAVPNFQSFILPVLKASSDGSEHSLVEVREKVVKDMGLTTNDLAELVPSGRKTRIADRVGWAKTYLAAAGLVESPSRARFRITPAGLELLAQGLTRIDIAVLSQYDSFRQFRTRTAATTTDSGGPAAASLPDSTVTPSEAIALAHRGLQAGLGEEVLAQVKTMSPAFFENLVVQLMLRLGYGGAEGRGTRIGRPGDGGVDGVISEDKLGLDVVCIQAKRWSNTVGRPEVQAFVGSLEGYRARKGVMITTSYFTADAKAYVENIEKRVVLIDGTMLASLMIETGLGITPEMSYVVNRIDLGFFVEE